VLKGRQHIASRCSPRADHVATRFMRAVWPLTKVCGECCKMRLVALTGFEPVLPP
jgi:hypothetical protein